jgi:hypothetical protein
MLRIYIGITVGILTILPFVFLGIAQYRSYQNNKNKEVLEKLEKTQDDKIIISSPPPLLVCEKAEKTINCRKLSAEETGSTVRGVRNEEIKQD